MPVSVVKTLSDQRMEEDLSATLECELSRQIVEVKWLKVKAPPTPEPEPEAEPDWSSHLVQCFSTAGVSEPTFLFPSPSRDSNLFH